MRTIALIIIFGILLIGCAAMGPRSSSEPQEVTVKVQAVKSGKVRESEGESVVKSMKVSNQEGCLSEMSFVSKDKVFVKRNRSTLHHFLLV